MNEDHHPTPLATADSSPAIKSNRNGPNDAYIAAMAELHDDIVFTDNVEDFRNLGVPVETY